jgi:hypothetical protein
VQEGYIQRRQTRLAYAPLVRSVREIEQMAPRRRLAGLLATAILIAGCGGVPIFEAVPNMDAGSAGCQNARGIGVASNDAPDVLAVVKGKTPTEAAIAMRALGHTVVFNTGGDCWCVPPPSGKVTEAWFGQHGALWLWVDGTDPALTAGDPPFAGYGC